MRPQQPPTSSSGPAGKADTERLAAMAKAADELFVELGLGGSPEVDQLTAGLLAELRAAVPELARARCGTRVLALTMLEDMAERLQAAADSGGFWPRHAGQRDPRPEESQVRALIARLRMLARN